MVPGFVTTDRRLDELGHRDFEPLVGGVFRMTLPSGEGHDLELVEVTPVPTPTLPKGGRRGFSAVFRSRLPGHLPQGIYALENEAMGRLSIFLVPIGPRGGGMCYEAVFN
jgi:hypothetical protein